MLSSPIDLYLMVLPSLLYSVAPTLFCPLKLPFPQEASQTLLLTHPHPPQKRVHLPKLVVDTCPLGSTCGLVPLSSMFAIYFVCLSSITQYIHESEFGCDLHNAGKNPRFFCGHQYISRSNLLFDRVDSPSSGFWTQKCLERC